MAAAAWSWVEKMLHEDHVISAPRALRVSMRTAVWMAVGHKWLADVAGDREICVFQHSNTGKLTHVKAASNAGTSKRLLSTKLLAGVHETRHLLLGQLNLATTKGSEVDVGDLVLLCGLGRHDCGVCVGGIVVGGGEEGVCVERVREREESRVVKFEEEWVLMETNNRCLRGFGGRQGFLRGTTADPLHIPTPTAQPFVESSLRATLLVKLMSILLSISRGRHVVGLDYEPVHLIQGISSCHPVETLVSN